MINWNMIWLIGAGVLVGNVAHAILNGIIKGIINCSCFKSKKLNETEKKIKSIILEGAEEE
jgi:hypothetical protein